ncbi:MAG: hypothetical protein ACREIN_04680 [Candidatus Methylomirabilaceae bacterium]
MIEWGDYVPSGDDLPPLDGALPHSRRASGGEVERLLPCPNPLCRGGGFEIGFMVDSMIRVRAEERIGVLVCVGWEAGEGGIGERSPCTRAIRYRIRLTYRRADMGSIREGDNGKAKQE